MNTFDFAVEVGKESEGYVSQCPEPGVAGCGDMVSETNVNLKEAVELYIENAKTFGMRNEIEEGSRVRKKSLRILNTLRRGGEYVVV
jgi:predicted RNase H-like HicB family nuclease